ncbi:MAG: S8 family serine peptidase, partial [Promethearchaeota archaeon]
NADQVASYSSSGGPSATGYTEKPDIVAPGGSTGYNFSMFSADTNDNDAEGEWVDNYLNDLYPAQGTSMAAPAVAGAASLLIQAFGGRPNWNYTAIEAKRIKALLLMTATETYPLKRERDTSYSPSLDRGSKDVHEGYGRINVDAALEAITHQLVFNGEQKANIISSQINPFEKHALACYVNLDGGENYRFDLDVPEDADFDFHLYSNTPDSYGEPQMLKSSTSDALGKEEVICFTPTESGKYYLVAKAISGQGVANITFTKKNQVKPGLKNEQLKPNPPRNQTTLLNFSVQYEDPDDIAPTYINVDINGTLYPMEQQDPNDVNYIDGCIFQCLIYLQPGHYNWTIKCRDGEFYNSTDSHNDLEILDAGNSEPPVLEDGQVYPSEGDAGITIFEFTINYSDADNNPPLKINITINSNTYDMVKKEPLDTNYMDGSLYVLSTTISQIGTATHYFNCSDGIYTDSDGPYSGPFVEDPAVLFREDFEGDLSKWLFITPLWHISDYPSNWPDSYYSKFHSMWFGNESTGTYENKSAETFGYMISMPIDLSSVNHAKLEFYTWRDGDGSNDWSFVFVSSNFYIFHIEWYEYEDISPWQKITIDISDYCGSNSVGLIFEFDTYNDEDNNHRGWLIDDIVIYSYESSSGDGSGGGGGGGGGGSGGGGGYSWIISPEILITIGVISLASVSIVIISVIYFRKRKLKLR